MNHQCGSWNHQEQWEKKIIKGQTFLCLRWEKGNSKEANSARKGSWNWHWSKAAWGILMLKCIHILSEIQMCPTFLFAKSIGLMSGACISMEWKGKKRSWKSKEDQGVYSIASGNNSKGWRKWGKIRQTWRRSKGSRSILRRVGF